MVKRCAIVECSASKKKNRGLSFHNIKRSQNLSWQRSLVQAVRRSDISFNADTACICSRHFEPGCFSTSENSQKVILIEGSLPSLFLPEGSIKKSLPKTRKQPLKRELIFTDNVAPPTTLLSLIKECRTEGRWHVVEGNKTAEFYFLNNGQVERYLQVNSDLQCKIWLKQKGVCEDITKQLNLKNGFSEIAKQIEHLKPCCGIQDEELQQYSDWSCSTHYREVQYATDTKETISIVRSVSCYGVANTICNRCIRVRIILRKRKQRKETSLSKDVQLKTPLKIVAANRLSNALKQQRKLTSKLRTEMDLIKAKLDTDGVELSETMHNSLINIMSGQEINNPLIKLFWEEQQKNFQRQPTGHRWHPMVIRVALLLHSQSPEAYRSLKQTGILTLPGESTLRDYANAISPSQGFQPEVINEIKNAASGLKENERWVLLLHDEMSIKSDLVFNERTGELCGFVHGGEKVANHVLVFMVVGITCNTPLKQSLGYFGTSSATADELYPLFWEAVCHLEITCGLKVIASTADKASPNQRFISMHGSNSTINLFAPERKIYLISDPPHLMKTVRNNLANSGSGLNTRYLWNNGKHLLWQHIKDIYMDDASRELRRTRLTPNHIWLTSYSVMKVNLAVQVLSLSVANIMRENVAADTTETATFIGLMDRMFDCLNSRSDTEAIRKRKPDLLPFTDVTDPRFKFLLNDVLGYLRNWHDAVQSREGFSKSEKAKMFLSHQTYKGLTTTVNSVVEATTYLLEQGVDAVYTNRFCQDPLESHFGRHRGLGRRNDNPTLNTFGYQENKIRIQRSMALMIQPRGNIRRHRQPAHISDSPLKKRKR